MIRKHYDKILLVSALVLLLAIFGYAFLRPDAQPATVNIPALRPENTFKVAEVSQPELVVPELEEPPPQSAGEEWVFDIFTPPVILFDPVNKSFVLPGDPGTPVSAEFGVELVGVEDRLYRIQLVGYFGKEDLIVTLENRETRETVNAREGEEFPNFGIAVRSAGVEEVVVENAGATDVVYDVAVVVIHDQRLGKDVTLRSDERKRDSEPTAEFRATADPEQTFLAREGESFDVNGTTYRVEAITPPASAIITRLGGEETAEPETKTLRVTQTAALPTSAEPSPSPINPQNNGTSIRSNPSGR